MPLIFQQQPGLSWEDSKVPGFGACCLCLSRKALQEKTGSQGPRGKWRQAEERRGETTGNARSLLRRPISSQKPPDLSQMGCNVPGFGAGSLCPFWKTPKETMGRQGGMDGLQGLRGTLRQADRRSDETAGNAGSLPRRPLPSQKPQGFVGRTVKPQSLDQGVCVSRKMLP